MQNPSQITPLDAARLAAEWGLTPADLADRLRAGGRCVRFHYCVSLAAVTLEFRTAVYLVEDAGTRHLLAAAYSLIAAAFGPWAVPWGPVRSARAIWANLRGDGDATLEVAAALAAPPAVSTHPGGPAGLVESAHRPPGV